MINKKYYERMSPAEGRRVEKLREILAATKIPSKKADENLLIATFNIRELGAPGRRRKGFAINALAEICSHFDLIAIQEARQNLRDLDRMIRVLGPWWKALFSDPSAPGKIGGRFTKGNDERLVFLYDSRFVRFTGMAAELLVTDDFLGAKGVAKTENSVPWRTPYMASWRAGHFDFMTLTVHIQWNSSGGIKARSKEIEMITRWVGQRQRDARLYDPDVFVLGDFNIPTLGSATFRALKKHGLSVPKKLEQVRTNLKKDAHYDQIAYYAENTECEIARAGVVDFYDAFFKGLSKAKRDAMTYQISDHLPLWVELSLLEQDLDQFIRQ